MVDGDTRRGLAELRAAAPAPDSASLTNFCTSSCRIRPLGPLPATRARSTPSVQRPHVPVLIGVGATTVNAYLAQESIADRHRRDGER